MIDTTDLYILISGEVILILIQGHWGPRNSFLVKFPMDLNGIGSDSVNLVNLILFAYRPINMWGRTLLRWFCKTHIRARAGARSRSRTHKHTLHWVCECVEGGVLRQSTRTVKAKTKWFWIDLALILLVLCWYGCCCCSLCCCYWYGYSKCWISLVFPLTGNPSWREAEGGFATDSNGQSRAGGGYLLPVAARDHRH